MRVANLTFSNVDAFNVNDYGTILSKPIDTAVFNEEPDKFSFPILIQPEIIYASVTRDGSDLTFSLMKDEEKTVKMLTLGETNSISLGDTRVNFNPLLEEDFLVLQNLVVRTTQPLDLRVLIPIIAVPVILIVWLYLKRKR